MVFRSYDAPQWHEASTWKALAKLEAIFRWWAGSPDVCLCEAGDIGLEHYLGNNGVRLHQCRTYAALAILLKVACLIFLVESLLSELIDKSNTTFLDTDGNKPSSTELQYKPDVLPRARAARYRFLSIFGELCVCDSDLSSARLGLAVLTLNLVQMGLLLPIRSFAYLGTDPSVVASQGFSALILALAVGQCRPQVFSCLLLQLHTSTSQFLFEGL